MNFGPYPGVVRDLHDGDTVHIDLDLGFGFQLDSHDLDGAPVNSCRVYGINAPELSTTAGKVALAFAETLLKPGDKVTVMSHGWDKYGGRFDGTVTLAAMATVTSTEGTAVQSNDFATLMLAAGQAVVMK